MLARLDSKLKDDGWWLWCQGEASDLIFSQLASGNIEGRPTFLVNRFQIGTKLAQRLHDLGIAWTLRWRFGLHKRAAANQGNMLRIPKRVCLRPSASLFLWFGREQ